MKVFLLGNMVASAEAFERLAPELERRGADVVPCLAHGKSYPMDLEHMLAYVRLADAVVLGTACSPDLAVEELAAAKTAIDFGVPFILYADTYGTWNRAWFHEVTKKAAAVFVINNDEAEKARAVFPGINIIAAGNPTWEAFAFPKVSREQVRAKLGISPNVKIILCPFGKNFKVNVLHAGRVMDTFSADGFWPPFQIILAPHPGDKDNSPEDYSFLTKLQIPVRVVPKAEMATLDVLVGTDVIADHASSIGIAAGHLRIPNVSCFTEVGLKHLEKETGSRVWPPCTLGVSYYVPPTELLSVVMRPLVNLADSALHRKIWERQEAVYPVPEELGAAVRKMADVLEQIVQ